MFLFCSAKVKDAAPIWLSPRRQGSPIKVVDLSLWMSGIKDFSEGGLPLPGCVPGVPPAPEAWRFASDRKPLGDDIGRDLVFDEGDAVAQLQLALLQPLQPQQVRRRRLMQRVDRCIEIAVLLLQPGEFVFELALIFVGHGVR